MTWGGLTKGRKVGSIHDPRETGNNDAGKQGNDVVLAHRYSHCSVKINDIPIPSEGQNSTIYLLAADWAHGRRDLCGLTRLSVHVGPL